MMFVHWCDAAAIVSGMQIKCDESDEEDGSDGKDGNCSFERKQNVAYHDGDLVKGLENRVAIVLKFVSNSAALQRKI